MPEFIAGVQEYVGISIFILSLVTFWIKYDIFLLSTPYLSKFSPLHETGLKGRWKEGICLFAPSFDICKKWYFCIYSKISRYIFVSKHSPFPRFDTIYNAVYTKKISIKVCTYFTRDRCYNLIIFSPKKWRVFTQYTTSFCKQMQS
jgi:hypothetical protein